LKRCQKHVFILFSVLSHTGTKDVNEKNIQISGEAEKCHEIIQIKLNENGKPQENCGCKNI
jgi:hypothetical protein